MVKKDSLDTSKYPQIYQDYLQHEEESVKNFLSGVSSVLDIGCGTGRIISSIMPFIKSYVGIDINKEYLAIAQKAAQRVDNVKIVELNAEDLSKDFTKKMFDVSISLWNTIGCLPDEKKVIKEVAKVTKEKFFFTVLAKGSLDMRKEYYSSLNIDCRIDETTETIYSEEWGLSRAYSKEEIYELLCDTGFMIESIDLFKEIEYSVIAVKK